MTQPAYRPLGPADRAALDALLLQTPDTTLFLRSNLRDAGFEDRGERFQGAYMGAFEGDALVAVVAHYWNGNLMCAGALDAIRALGPRAVDASGRAVAGLIGTVAQTEALRSALGMSDRPLALGSVEVLFGLELSALRPPDALTHHHVRCRRATHDDLALLTRWRVAYAVETLGDSPSPELEATSRASIARAQQARRLWVLTRDDGARVAMSAFNAALPDCVQIGGVWTPPELRGRGYARAVVAGSLLEARADGVTRSVLFTPTTNHAAQRAYQAIGYTAIGDFAIALFELPR